MAWSGRIEAPGLKEAGLMMSVKGKGNVGRLVRHQTQTHREERRTPTAVLEGLIEEKTEEGRNSGPSLEW